MVRAVAVELAKLVELIESEHEAVEVVLPGIGDTVIVEIGVARRLLHFVDGIIFSNWNQVAFATFAQ